MCATCGPFTDAGPFADALTSHHSGAGGFDYGLHTICPRKHRLLLLVENNEVAQAVLRRQFAGVRLHSNGEEMKFSALPTRGLRFIAVHCGSLRFIAVYFDGSLRTRCPTAVEDLEALPEEVDAVIASFPCTNVSSIGRREGIHGPATGLVCHVWRLLKTRPVEWVVLENVVGLLDQVGALLRSVLHC